jgi:hypothetical protein
MMAENLDKNMRLAVEITANFLFFYSQNHQNYKALTGQKSGTAPKRLINC